MLFLLLIMLTLNWSTPHIFPPPPQNKHYNTESGDRVRNWHNAREQAIWAWDGSFEPYGGTGVKDGRLLTLNPSLGDKIDIDHIVPASVLAASYGCDSRNVCAFTGAYAAAYTDLHNLVPTLPSLNRMKSNLPFCDGTGDRFRITKPHRVINIGGVSYQRCVSPPVFGRGVLARASLYMIHAHHIPTDKAYLDLLISWDKQNPPQPSEFMRHEKIIRLQGTDNPWISRWIR